MIVSFKGISMSHKICFILLTVFFSLVSLKTLASESEQSVIINPGDKVPDFTMMSSNGAPQRLSEQIGHPIMLIWMADCDGCSEALVDWQYLAESSAIDGLKTWVVWKKKKGYKAPWSRLPVLIYDSSNPFSWWFRSSPAVMLINSEGYLDHVFTGNVKPSVSSVSKKFKVWMKASY